MIGKKVVLLALFCVCFYPTSATPLPQDEELFTVDHDRKIISIKAHIFDINTTDVIRENEIVSEQFGEKLNDVTLNGLKNCSGKDVFFEVAYMDNSDMKLNFTLECPSIVVQYKWKSSHENRFNKGEFSYHNQKAKVVADIGDFQEILDKTHMMVKDVHISFEDEAPPTKNSSLEAKLKEPVFTALLKKADLVSELFS